MPLAAGTRLGPYEIPVPIGKGGMGEVNCAHAARPHGDVAIKVSAEHFRERFTRRARAIADEGGAGFLPQSFGVLSHGQTLRSCG